MRTYALEDRGSTPLYVYLYRCIQDVLPDAAVQVFMQHAAV